MFCSIDEPDGLRTFRMGLFGLDKLGNVDETVSVMETALDQVLIECGHEVQETTAA
jgi:aspartate aminotransferase-like enzyme